MNDFGYTIIVFLLFAAWPLYLTIKAEYRRYKNNHAPEIKVNATAVKKSVTSDNIQYTNWAMRDGGTVFYGTFLTEDDKTVELYMNGQKFVSFEEGDTGELWYQGTRFLEFKKDE
ncbi:MAG: DUF2500 domain-containing protein [Firmicutes bacterium]|nr:DUF2500 domain-containing protein [Bacillota bacterium]MBR6584120.1 DUF2500 domain-containing protein [Bacillota bacterium]